MSARVTPRIVEPRNDIPIYPGMRWRAILRALGLRRRGGGKGRFRPRLVVRP